MEEKSKTRSKLLITCYGEKYEEVLGKECISFSFEKENPRWKLSLRLFSLLLLSINFFFAIYAFQLIGLLVFFTNWNLEVTFMVNVLVIWFSYDPYID